MKTKTIEKLAWFLLYSGLGELVLGTFVHDMHPFGGLLLVGVGALDAVTGAFLIFVRSRMKPDSTDQETP